MRDAVAQALASEATGQWVLIDVAMEALEVSQRRAYELAKSEGWRTARGTRPRQYSFEDIRTTYRRINSSRSQS
jgi:hypothetical protein